MPKHRPDRARRWLAAVIALLPACATLSPTAGSAASGAPPFRVYGPDGAPLSGIPELVDRLAGVDVLFFGEQHDDAEAHRVEEALLAELARRDRPVVVGMEMFERDVQPALDAHLAGRSEEAGFVEATRAWSNYRSDYRPLVEVARREGWPVIASNAPRHFATAVSLAGLGALSIVDPAHRSQLAAEIECPRDDYYRRFVAELQGHPTVEGGADPGREATLVRYYEAQCLKDETMAESVAAAWSAGALLVHFNGAFHTDHGLGILPRLKRRLPAAKVAVLSARPVRDPRRLAAEDRVADYVVLTRR
jgi:uncharacterized iron-regulated protein